MALGLLLALMPFGGCKGEETSPIEEYALTTEGYELLRDSVSSLLLVGMEGDWPSAGQVLSLTLVTCDSESGEMQAVQIPLETRAMVDLLDGSGSTTGAEYAPIVEAYAQGGDSVDRGLNNLAAAVSGLLGGVPVGKWLAYSRSGLMRMVNGVGGVEVTLDEQLEGSGLGTQGSAVLYGADAWTYLSFLRDDAAGAQQRRARQLSLVTAFLKQAVSIGVYDAVAEALDRAGVQVRYNVDSGGFALLLQMQQAGTLRGDAIEGFALFGEERQIEGQTVWLPGGNAIKDWVLGTFFTAG